MQASLTFAQHLVVELFDNSNQWENIDKQCRIQLTGFEKKLLATLKSPKDISTCDNNDGSGASEHENNNASMSSENYFGGNMDKEDSVGSNARDSNLVLRSLKISIIGR